MATPQSNLLVQFNRQYADPIDSTEVWNSKAAVTTYALLFPSAFPGQTVKWLEGGVYKTGVIQADKSILETGSSGVGSGTIESVNDVFPDLSKNVTLDAKDIKMDKTDVLSKTIHEFTTDMHVIVGDNENYDVIRLKLQSEGFLT